MNKLLLSVLACSALMFTSCSEDEVLLDGPTENDTPEETVVTFTATIEGTRTTVEGGKVSWSEGDAIDVLNSNGEFNTFTLSEGAGSQTAKFTGSFTAGTTAGNIAVYPAGNYTYTGGTLTVNLPSSYGSENAEYNTPNSNVLMWVHKTEPGNNLTFKHLAAALRLSVNVPAGTTSLSLKGKGICGSFTAETSEELPAIAQAADASDKTVTYNFKAFTEQKEMTFYFPVPTGTYDKFTISLASDDGRTASKTAKFGTAKVLGRTQIATLPALSNIELEYPWVDLGLPSGTLWARKNVGAESPGEIGYFYRWGATKPYDSGEEGSAAASITTNLTAEYDAATANLGSEWRMPTKKEGEELAAYCTWTQQTATESGYGVAGYLVTSNVEGYTDKSIFLPGAGFHYGNHINNGHPSVWTSTYDDGDYYDAYYLSTNDPFAGTAPGVYYMYGNAAMNIRPICTKK